MRVVLLCDLLTVALEHVAHELEILRRLDHQLAGLALGDLDVLLEDVVVLETGVQRCDSHGLWDSTEVEDTLLPQSCKVIQTVVRARQSCVDHLRTAVQGLLLVLGLEEVLELVNVLGPDLLGPESSVVIQVFLDVTGDVDLLEELSHRLHEFRLLQKHSVGKASLHEQTRQTLADKTSNVVAVQLVVLECVDADQVVLRVVGVVGHTVAHALRDVLDNLPVRWLDRLELLNNNVELDQQLPVLLVGSVLGERPAINFQDLIEVSQNRLLLLDRDGHVILDCVKSAQDEVEQCHGDKELRVQLHNDGRETAARQGKEVEASLEVFRVFRFVALVYGVVPDLPERNVSSVLCKAPGI